jgi:peptidoglycan/LPS O-acetylase OafA/YrhL
MSILTSTRRTHTRAKSYGSRLTAILVVAFALSATHTIYSYVVGIGDPGFTVTTPAAWAFYVVGFASAALARRESRWAEVVLLAYLAILLLVAVFWYPTTFVPRQQTVFGWFENDVYTGLLMIAAYLGLQRLRGVSLLPRSRGAQ